RLPRPHRRPQPPRRRPRDPPAIAAAPADRPAGGLRADRSGEGRGRVEPGQRRTARARAPPIDPRHPPRDPRPDRARRGVCGGRRGGHRGAEQYRRQADGAAAARPERDGDDLPLPDRGPGGAHPAGGDPRQRGGGAPVDPAGDGPPRSRRDRCRQQPRRRETRGGRRLRGREGGRGRDHAGAGRRGTHDDRHAAGKYPGRRAAPGGGPAVTYAAALAFLDSLIAADRPRPPYSEVKLARMRHLLGLVGDPHRRVKSVLVAGTKGKGSTAVMIAGMLRAQGLRAGLTVKPHLVEYRERIQINGQMVPQADLAALVEIVRPAVEQLSELPWGPPTYVETTVALALLHFVRREADLAVVEVGIGGRLDATNVLDPLVSVITPISYDHMEILGETLTEIASEKAGIIRPRGRVVSAPQPDEDRKSVV